MSTKTTQTDSRPGYKNLLDECRTLMAKAGSTAFRRTAVLNQVFLDRDFRADLGNSDDFACAMVLDEYVEDLCLTFLELRSILVHFPTASDWADGKLSTLYQRTLDKIAAERKEEAPEKREVKRATLAELHDLEEKNKDAEYRVAQADRRHGEALSTIDVLRRENDELRLTVATLRGRIEELEKVLNRNAAFASA